MHANYIDKDQFYRLEKNDKKLDEMTNCDGLRRNFADSLFSVIDHGPLRKKQKHFKAIFQSETVKLKKQNHVRKRILRRTLRK